MVERSQYAEKLESRVGDIYDGISKGREAVSLRYAPAVKALSGGFSREEAEAAFLEELRRTQRGMCARALPPWAPPGRPGAGDRRGVR